MTAASVPATPASPRHGLLGRAAGAARAVAGRLRPPSGFTGALAIALVAQFALLGGALAFLAPAAPGDEVTLDRLDDLVAAGLVTDAVFGDEDARIDLRLSDGGRAWTTYPRHDVTTASLIAALAGSGASVRVDPQQGKSTVRLLATTLLPLTILANLFALFFAGGRGGGGGIGQVIDFSRIGRGGERTAGSITTFADVAGVEEAIVELREVVDYLSDPEKYAALGAVPPKGVLLHGPPGCGKTLLAKAVAGEARVPFFSVAGAEFVESLVGVGAARVRDLFAKVRAAAPAIVFIDEIDAAGRRRGSGSGGGSDEREQTLNQLLVEMDGFEVASGIVVVAATNRPDILDPALLRPGRFDRHVTIEPPDVEHREAILRLHARSRPLAASVDFAVLARQTPGFTGADLANVVNEAALLTIRAGKREIDGLTFSEAVQRVIAGPQRRGRLLAEDERRRLACHEAGHATVAALLGHGAGVHRVSIVARGRALGSSDLLAGIEQIAQTPTLLRDRLTVALAGRVAEETVLGEPSTLAEDDLEVATALAQEIAGRYGLTGGVGLVSVLPPQVDHLGNRAEQRLIGATTHAALDGEVRRLLDEAHARAGTLLDAHRAALDALVDRLLEEETIEGAELQRMLPSSQPPPVAGP